MKLFQDHYRQRILSLLKGGDLFILDKALDLINLGGAALIFSQILEFQHFNIYSFSIGLFTVLVSYGLAWYIINTFH